MTLPAEVAAVFPFSPDWSQPVEELREYKTDVLRSRNRTGQWRALRSKPRDYLAFTLLLDSDDAAAFDYRMWAVQPYIWMLPQWARRRALATSALAGTSTLLLDAPASYFAAEGDELLLMRDGQEPEVTVLQAVSGDRLSLTLAAPLVASWPATSALYPAWRAQLADPVRSTALSDRVIRAPVRLRRRVDSRPPVTTSLAADQTLAGLELLTRPLDWSHYVQIEHDWVAEFLDTDIGVFGHRVRGELAIRARKGEVLVESRDELDWWLAFFDRRRGRQKPFLMPTWQGDLLLQPPLSGGVDFEVAGTDLGRFMPASPVHTHLMLRLHNGSLAFYPVASISPDFGLGVTTLTTSTPWAESYGPWQCAQVCFVTLCHLASDQLTINWITDETARLTLAVATEEIPA